MKKYESADIRNLAIVGHASAGKTMLSECMLACAGKVNRLGRTASGNTVSDYHESEQQRKISIHATPLSLEWDERKFNVIDTPGYSDFISETLGALRVGDFALVVVDAAHGIGLGTQQVWKYAGDFGIPRILVLNGMDREHVDFEVSLEQLRERFGSRVFPMNIPINPGPGFNELLDVLRSERVAYDSDETGTYSEEKVSGDWEEQVQGLHQQFIEYVAESDDSLLEKFFEQDGLSEEEMRGGVHAAIQEQSFIPLFCTSSERNVGVARLMDFISKYGSSPIDRKGITALNGGDKEVEVNLGDPNPVIYVFKTVSEAHLGDLFYFRVYSGTLNSGSGLHNATRDRSERLGQLYVMNGRERKVVEYLNAGDIGAVVKLKDTHTGDTLCSAKSSIRLAPVEYPSPNIHAALQLTSKGDEDKIAVGLAGLHEEDPTFLYRVDPEIHQTVISGQGELHLQIVTEKLKQRYNVEVELVEPKVPFRETIKARGEAKYRHKKQTGGAGQFAEVWMRIESKPRDTGIEFTQSLVGQNVDRVFVPSVEKGVNAACTDGILAGYRVVDLKIDFYDGKMHPVDSKDVAFQIAGKGAFMEAFMNAKPCLLEPIVEVEIRVPDEHLGDVMGDLSSRRGKILGMDADGEIQIVKAHLPQMELYRYSTTLRSLTGGRGMHSERFSHYEEMQRDFEQRVIAASKKDGE